MKASQLRDCSLKMTDYGNSFEQTASFENSVVLHLVLAAKCHLTTRLINNTGSSTLTILIQLLTKTKKQNTVPRLRMAPGTGLTAEKEQKTDGCVYGEAGIQLSTLELCLLQTTEPGGRDIPYRLIRRQVG